MVMFDTPLTQDDGEEKPVDEEVLLLDAARVHERLNSVQAQLRTDSPQTRAIPRYIPNFPKNGLQEPSIRWYCYGKESK
jgi:hypothetical protein